MNRRLSRYVDDNILGKEQAGFREGYSTTDYVFVLKHIIELYQSIYKRIYYVFIDYSKAFDTVDRALLWQKSLSLNIDGIFLNVIKTCTIWQSRVLGKKIDVWVFFVCNICVRQGYNLSPLLFYFFINDFSKYIEGKYKGLSINNCYPTLLDDDIVMFVLLYANDTIVLAENVCVLQKALYAVHEYCVIYKLTVNIKKTKIIVFSRGKVNAFLRSNMEIIQLRSWVIIIYLGITMNFNNKFNKAIKTTRSRSESLVFNVGKKYKSGHAYCYQMQPVWEIGFPNIVIWLRNLGFSLCVRDLFTESFSF